MDPRETLHVPLRVLFYKDSDSWIAYCLEFDLIGDGRSREAIALQVEASLDDDNPANLFTPADGEFLGMYAAGRDIAAGTFDIAAIVDRMKASSPMIEGVEARQYEGIEAAFA